MPALNHWQEALQYSMLQCLAAVLLRSTAKAAVQTHLRCFQTTACSLLGCDFAVHLEQPVAEDKCSIINPHLQWYCESLPRSEDHLLRAQLSQRAAPRSSFQAVIRQHVSPWWPSINEEPKLGALQHRLYNSIRHRSLSLQLAVGLQQQVLGVGTYTTAAGVQQLTNSRRNKAAQLPQTNNLRQLQNRVIAGADAKALTSQITHCRSLEVLQNLMTSQGRHLNHIHVTAMVVQLSRLSARIVEGLQDSPQQQATDAAALSAMQQLWHLLEVQLPNCTSRELSSIIYSILHRCSAVVRQQYQDHVLRLILPAFLQQLQSAAPQGVSNVLFAVASSGQQLQPQHVQQLIKHLVDTASSASPQAVANSLWAVATMQQSVPDLHVGYLVRAFHGKAMEAKPQEIATMLWALVSLGHQLQEQQLLRLQDALCKEMTQAHSHAVCTAVWAYGQFGYLPKQMLSHPQLFKLLATAQVKSLVKLACACGQLGHGDERLLRAIIQQTKLRLQDRSTSQPLQRCLLPSVSWAIAVLGFKQLADDAKFFIAQVPFDAENDLQLQQTYQVHMWLQDIKLGDGHGLHGVLTPGQLQLCRTAWDRRHNNNQSNAAPMASITSLQQQVFKTLRWLHIQWQDPPCLEQSSSDGLLVVDIACRTDSGRLLAIEVDGPSHFVMPDNTLTGPTLYRNAALRARGYTVISIPYYEWTSLSRGRAQKQYLLQRLQAAGVAVMK